MIVYHGSDHEVKKPIYGEGSNDSDYGKGFYTTQDKDKAYSWAVLHGQHKKAICNKYEIDESNLNVLKLDNYGVLAWIAEIVANRGTKYEETQSIGQAVVDMYKIDTSNADIIIGYRADDSYNEIVEAFLKNQLSIDEVERLFFKSSKSYEQIKYIGSEKVPMNLTETYKEEDAFIKREVGNFLTRRNNQVLIENLDVQKRGLIARTVVNDYYKYNIETGFYEFEGGKKRNGISITDSIDDVINKIDLHRRHGGR